MPSPSLTADDVSLLLRALADREARCRASILRRPVPLEPLRGEDDLAWLQQERAAARRLAARLRARR